MSQTQMRTTDVLPKLEVPVSKITSEAPPYACLDVTLAAVYALQAGDPRPYFAQVPEEHVELLHDLVTQDDTLRPSDGKTRELEEWLHANTTPDPDVPMLIALLETWAGFVLDRFMLDVSAGAVYVEASKTGFNLKTVVH